jgi:hypothetical protein
VAVTFLNPFLNHAGQRNVILPEMILLIMLEQTHFRQSDSKLQMDGTHVLQFGSWTEVERPHSIWSGRLHQPQVVDHNPPGSAPASKPEAHTDDAGRVDERLVCDFCNLHPLHFGSVFRLG